MNNIDPSYIETLMMESGAMESMDNIIRALETENLSSEAIDNIKITLYNTYYTGRLNMAYSIISYLLTYLNKHKVNNVSKKLINDLIDNLNESNGI